jgi:hypothetical protein
MIFIARPGLLADSVFWTVSKETTPKDLVSLDVLI